MNRLTITRLGIGLLAAGFGLAQFHPLGNPRAGHEQARADLLIGAKMPASAKRILIEKCANCHSDASSWPIYSDIAPISWLIERDVLKGRDHLNLSKWKELAPYRQETLAEEIVRQVRSSSMPPLRYRLIHWNSALSPADKAALSALAPEVAVEDASAGPGDPIRGKAVFERRCTGCHALDSDREGPHLRGVYGRAAGTVPGFDYSEGVRKSGLIWNDTNIERWMRDTEAMIPDSKMGFRVPKAQDRADVVAFLKTVR
jgi:cytochrome c